MRPLDADDLRQSRLPGLFQHPCVVAKESSLQESGAPLYPEELALMFGCVEKRQRELAASRRCARKALAVLGIEGFPLLPGPDRAPIWPPGVVGSITHTDGCPGGYCGVAVAERRFSGGLGIDAEPNLPLPAELWPAILDEAERSDALATDEPGIHARLVFSAKETIYKALYPTLKRFLEFSDVHIEARRADGIFLARLVGQAASSVPDLGPMTGHLVIDGDLIVTAIHLPTSQLPLAQEGL